MQRLFTYYFGLVLANLLMSWLIILAAAPFHPENRDTQIQIAETVLLVNSSVWLLLHIYYESTGVRRMVITSQATVVAWSAFRIVLFIIQHGMGIISAVFILVYLFYIMFSIWLICRVWKKPDVL
ncbi:hypothetical protein [Chitinophaga sp. YIM B06452]|uniref:hypothetical protein n=1 Tax=Chitinophaga sp. YIM B06452 TaxID=3082158 RepID=UPI0031FF1ADF